MALNLFRVRRRRRHRARGRKRQLRLWRRTGNVGHRKKAGEHGRAMRHLTKLIPRAKALATLPGPPWWGGAIRPVVAVADPIAQRHGLTRSSGKRSETFGNPGSDHYVLNLKSYAGDWGRGGSVAEQEATYYEVAQEIRHKLSGEDHVDYEHFYFTFDGHRYRGQLIAAQHGTGPHLHFGVERID